MRALEVLCRQPTSWPANSWVIFRTALRNPLSDTAVVPLRARNMRPERICAGPFRHRRNDDLYRSGLHCAAVLRTSSPGAPDDFGTEKDQVFEPRRELS